jgi:hypothetical protein
MLSTPQPFGLGEARRRRVDLAEELLQEPGPSVRGELTRIMPSVHLMGCERCTEGTLLGTEGYGGSQQHDLSVVLEAHSSATWRLAPRQSEASTELGHRRDS